MANSGKASEEAFKLRLGRLPRTKILRVFDAGALTGLNGRVVADFPRPADFLVFQAEGIHLAEVKSSESKTSFPYSQVEKGQRSAAAYAAAVGCPESFIFYIHSLHLNRWFLLNAAEFIWDLKAGLKSRKWEAFRQWQ